MDKRNIKKDIIEQCYEKSVELLANNSTRYGVLASARSSRAVTKDYLSIFARDASICALGMTACGDSRLIDAAKKSLITLARCQSHVGEIPNYVKPEKRLVDFWKLGSIDATLWWLMAVYYYDRYSGDKNLRARLDKKIKRAINWLYCQEHQNDKLLVQGEASDWADIMPRSGKVLYTNALWYKVKTLYRLNEADITKKNFNNLFYPYDKKILTLPRSERSTAREINKTTKKKKYYLSYVNYLFWGEDIDVYGNSISIIFNLSPKKFKDNIIKHFSDLTKKKNLPIPVLFNPIKQNSKYWRKFMESYNQNYPYQYHNGGIWPFVGSFWAMALANAGKKQAAWAEMEKIAKANKVNNWQFNEWFSAKTGQPMGMPYQSWNAGAFLLAYHYIKGEIKL